MALPIVKVIMPADLAGKPNGRLDRNTLLAHSFPGRGTTHAWRGAMRAWIAMAAACKAATGVTLTISSLADAYRDYDTQYKTFHARYRKVNLATYILTLPSKRKRCGATYYKLVAGATAACPGTSNHGWGLAFDTALYISGNVIGIQGNAAAWNWVRANAALYGFSWELQSEPWHLRYVVGDVVPVAVQRYWSGTTPPVQPGTPKPPALGPKTPPGTPPMSMALKSTDANTVVAGWPTGRVSQLQMRLGGIKVDGVFGPATDQRLRWAQSRGGLLADGIFGPRTEAAFVLWGGH